MIMGACGWQHPVAVAKFGSMAEQACTLLGGHSDFASHIPAQQVLYFFKERKLRAMCCDPMNAKYQWLGLCTYRIQYHSKSKSGRDDL